MIAPSVCLRVRSFAVLLFLAVLLAMPAFAGANRGVWTFGDNYYGQLGNNSPGGSADLPVPVNSLTGVAKAAAGNAHCLALKSDGTVWAWGDNAYGQLGDNSTTDRDVPVQVKDSTGTSTLTGIIAIAGGGNHSLAVKSDGTVWAWGDNQYGQLGNNSTTSSSLPVQVKDSTGASTLTGITSIAGGGNHSLVVKSDGSAWAWGSNSSGQLGNSSTTNSSLPVQVKDMTGTSTLTGVTAAASGSDFSLAVKSDGTVWAWGGNDFGALGNASSDGTYPDTSANTSVPVRVFELTGIVAVAAGEWHGLALKDDGTVWAWGDSSWGQLGSGRYDRLPEPAQVMDSTGAGFLAGVAAIAAGGTHSLAVKSDGTVWAWGDNLDGELGVNVTHFSDTGVPIQVSDPTGTSTLTDAVAVAAGIGSSLVIIANPIPSVVLKSSLNPAGVGQSVTFTATFSAVAPAAGTPTGTVTFMDGPSTLGTGALSNGAAAFSTTALSPGLDVITAVYSGDSNFRPAALGLLNQRVGKTGTLAAWGGNEFGELGNNSTTNSSVPVQASGLTGVIAVAGGSDHSLALKNDGTVWAWGSNEFGELGNGNAGVNSATPVQVSGLTGVVAIAAGSFHSLALKSDGTAWAWGDNYEGQLGNNDPNYSNSSVPVQVEDPTGTSTLTGVVGIAAGREHSLALKSDGTVWAWGGDYYGQLGDSNTNLFSSSLPVQVKDPTGSFYLSGVAAVAAGAFHSLALKSDGTVWGWGDNAYGELGNGQSDNTGYGVSQLPVQVSDPTGKSTLTGIVAIAAGGGLPGLPGQAPSTGGDDYSLAVKSDGTVWAWGNNGSGQLGDNSTTSSALPIQVKDSTGTSTLTGVVAIAAGVEFLGAGHSLALKSDGTAWAWGDNGSGQLGNNSTTESNLPVPVSNLTGVVAISGGGDQSLAIGNLTDPAPHAGDAPLAGSHAALTKNAESAWRPADVSVGADDLSRLLWSNPDGSAVLWSVDRISGSVTAGPVFGPFDGGAWQAARIACGSDGISHVIWNKSDGTLSLWWLNADNSFQNNRIYGPYAGWVATDIAVGSDNLTRILWTNADGRVVVWSVDANGVVSNNENFYGPYAGYTAVALACGSDGLTRLAWGNPVGIGSLWTMTPDNKQQSFTLFGPYPSWVPADIDVGSDNLTRILWTNINDGRAVVWSVDVNGNPSNDQRFYGPYAGYTAQRVACGSDGFTRVTWLGDDGVLSLWHLASDNTLLTFNIYEPDF